MVSVSFSPRRFFNPSSSFPPHMLDFDQKLTLYLPNFSSVERQVLSAFDKRIELQLCEPVVSLSLDFSCKERVAFSLDL